MVNVTDLLASSRPIIELVTDWEGPSRSRSENPSQRDAMVPPFRVPVRLRVSSIRDRNGTPVKYNRRRVQLTD